MPGLHIRSCTATLNDSGGLGQLAEINGNEERTRAILDYLNALPDDWEPPGDTEYGVHVSADPNAADPLAQVTPPADIIWTPEGELEAARLVAVEPAPRRAMPAADTEAQYQQLNGVRALAEQLKLSIRRNASGNAASISGDISDIFERIEVEASKPAGQVLIILIKGNISALETLRGDAEALTTVDRALFDQFMIEARALLPLYPILRQIEDPGNSALIPEDAVEEGERFVEEFADAVISPEAEALIGASLPGVTRDLMAYPWETKEQRIVAFAALARQTKLAIEDPPPWVDGAGKYADLVAKVAKAYGIIHVILKFLI